MKALTWARYTAVLGIIAAHLLLIALQTLDGAPVWLAELTRFVPYYWLLFPFLGAVVLSIGLRRSVLIGAVVNVLLLLTVTMGWQWNFPPGEDTTGIRLRVLTYNVKAWNAKRREDGFSDIDREVRRHAPDIVAMQDADGWLERSDTTPTSARPIFGLPHVVAVGQYVLASKFPLQNCVAGHINYRTEVERYLRCEAVVEGTTVQVVTAHFESPRRALTATRQHLTGGLNAWAINLSDRLTQARTLLADISRLSRPLIVMGDLNAQVDSPVVTTLMRAGLRDTFSEAGRGWGFTHGHSLRRQTDFLRIDHVLVSNEFAVLRSEVGGSDASEHNPVVAELVIRK